MNEEIKVPKIKRYIETLVPSTTCTLRCHYCYITQCGKFAEKVPEFKYSPEIVGKALSQKRLGGVCLVNLCGSGETLLPPQMPAYIRAILEQGHYVSIVTNGTINKRFDEIAEFPKELRERIFFKFSYHFLELEKRKLFDRFFANIEKMKRAGCAFVLEMTPNDESIPRIPEIMNLARERLGAYCHITIARDDASSLHDKPMLTKLKKEDFYKTWGVFDSEMLRYKRTIYGEKRREFCYAGDWSINLNLGSGIMRQCYCSFYQQNIFENPEKPINFVPVGRRCLEPHCYNGHAFLTLGVIPELKAPTYAQIRNRVCDDGSEWLNESVKAFFSQKLRENNREYTTFEKFMHGLVWSRPRIFAGRAAAILGRRLKRIFSK